MVARQSPVTSSVVAWAIEQDGRDSGTIAEAVGVETATLSAWMTGESLPTVGQVSTLAEKLRRPRAFFFLPQPPEQAALPSGFRHPPGGGNRVVSSSVLLKARRSRRVQRAVAATLTDADPVELPTATLWDRPEDAAVRVREWLGIDPSARWRDDATALASWRDVLDEAGVLVFYLQLGADAVRGFAAWDDKAPMIVANVSSVGVTARIFTVGHELGHLVLREETACLDPIGGHLVIDSRTERWCESFAAALLMPRGQIRALMESRGIGPKAAGLNAVNLTANRFRVSNRAAALRLDELGFAEDGLYGHVLAVFKPKKRTEGRPQSPPRHRARLRQYGLHTIETVLSGLSPRDAMSVLRINAEDARKLADEVPGVRVI